VLDAPGAKPLQVTRGEVRFDQVRFGYGKPQPIMEDFDLVVRPGEKVGLIGRSGAGKSTLVNLLLRFYDLEGGRILIDGQDIAGVTQDSLRASIGMVTQDTSLLHRSLRDNIAVRPPDRERGRDGAGGAARAGARLHRHAQPIRRAHRLRRARGRARRQAVGRAAPARRDRPRDAQGRAHPAAGRSHQRARFRSGGGDPGQPARN
jgi:ABC-type nitrate/sulfonate/bicarbonate transport system ATPase subunit